MESYSVNCDHCTRCQLTYFRRWVEDTANKGEWATCADGETLEWAGEVTMRGLAEQSTRSSVIQCEHSSESYLDRMTYFAVVMNVIVKIKAKKR